jgi:opacity protein-like surface antigen
MGNIKTIFVCVVLLAATAVNAQTETSRFELTPFAGITFGGEFEDMTSSASLELDDNASFGLILDIRESANTQWEILYSRQATRADTTDLPTGGASFDVDVHYIHGGGTYLGEGDRARPFLAATIGATHFEPGLDDFGSETFFSFSIGAGFQLRPNDRLGIRLEARAYGTLLESDTELFCQTGPNENICVIVSEGTLLWQFQTLAGFVFRF